MGANRKARRRVRALHRPAHESLVCVGCSCGWHWRNDSLKGKTDGELKIEAEMAFTQHERDMEDAKP